MIRRIFVLCLMFLCLQIAARAQGINIFKGSLAEAKAEARKQNKYLAIDGYTEWCGWCKYMEHNVYPVKAVADFYNAHFVFYEMDMEKGEGIQMAQQYRIQMFPSFLFFNPNGDFVHYYFGASKEPDGFIAIGRTAVDTMHNCMGLAHRFMTGAHDTAFLKELVRTISYYADPKIVEQGLALYWSQLPTNRFYEKDNWDLFKYYENDLGSGAFDYAYAHRAEFLQRYHEKDDSTCFNVKAALYIKTAVDNKNDSLFGKAKQIALLSNDKQVWFTVCSTELPYYLQKGSLDGYYADVDHFKAKFGADWIGMLASDIETNSDNPQYLQKALAYDGEALQLNHNFDNTATYARILYKLGRYAEANKSANDALALSNDIKNEDEKAKASHTASELLYKIKKRMEEHN